MARVYSKALDQWMEVGRLIGHIKGKQPGPTVIFIAGMHGNEPAGVFALQRILKEISERKTRINGSIYAISGNLWALGRGERYHKEDLNRLWIGDYMEQLLNGKPRKENEDAAQQLDIYKTIKKNPKV